MEITPKYKHVFLDNILSVLIGAFAFYAVLGFNVLNVKNINWLMQGCRDPAMFYCGWAHFRYGDWGIPLGLNPGYGLELGSSIVFSDSNPFLALLFKPFSPILPEPFQYFGVWLLLCYILQAWFAWKLLSLYSDNRPLNGLGTLILTFSPPFLQRSLFLGHFNLCGHFLLLASLYFSLKPNLSKRKFAWPVLLILAALVHSYLLAMVISIWLADLAANVYSKKLTFLSVFVEVCLTLLLLFTVCWQAGYFSVSASSLAGGGFGFYHMNLLSIFNSSGWPHIRWSYILKSIPVGYGSYEGFNYLGLGVVVLGVFALPVLFSKKINMLTIFRKHTFLVMVALGLTAFAVSNIIEVGPYSLTCPLPKSLMDLCDTFRSSGRMFWPVFYIIVVFIIFLIIRGYTKRTAILLMSFAMMLQIADTHSGWGRNRQNVTTAQNMAWDASLNDSFWQAASAKYAKLRYILPSGNRDTPPDWCLLASYAAMHGLATDAVYLARFGQDSLIAARNSAMHALATGNYEQDTLYILDAKYVKNAAIHINSKTDMLALINGFYVLAPGWKNRSDYQWHSTELTGAAIISQLPQIQVGQKVIFAHSESNAKYLLGGWSPIEPGDPAIWSDGPWATILLPLAEKRVSKIFIEANPFVSPAFPKQDVEVHINGIAVANIRLTQPTTFEIPIPQKVLDTFSASSSPSLEVEFFFPNSVRPQDLGMNTDTRQLALAIVSAILAD